MRPEQHDSLTVLEVTHGNRDASHARRRPRRRIRVGSHQEGQSSHRGRLRTRRARAAEPQGAAQPSAAQGIRKSAGRAIAGADAWGTHGSRSIRPVRDCRSPSGSAGRLVAAAHRLSRGPTGRRGRGIVRGHGTGRRGRGILRGHGTGRRGGRRGRGKGAGGSDWRRRREEPQVSPRRSRAKKSPAKRSAPRTAPAKKVAAGRKAAGSAPAKKNGASGKASTRGSRRR